LNIILPYLLTININFPMCSNTLSPNFHYLFPGNQKTSSVLVSATCILEFQLSSQQLQNKKPRSSPTFCQFPCQHNTGTFKTPIPLDSVLLVYQIYAAAFPCVFRTRTCCRQCAGPLLCVAFRFRLFL